jgi:hypothetical protein
MEYELEKHKEYLQMKEIFENEKILFNKQISMRKEGISKLQNQILNLEKKIKKARPKTDNGSIICEKCDIISMKYLGTSPGQSDHQTWYKCEICGREDYQT